MALNLNSSPYFDDFDPSKNYNRILFKPGVAVQARELTQLQTAIQDQLSQLGSYSLLNGTVISGGAEKIKDIKFIKITDSDYDGVAIDNDDLVNYIGYTLVGGTTGIKATIVDVATGSSAESPNLKTFYISYTDFNSQTDDHFRAGETLTLRSADLNNGKTFVVDSGNGNLPSLKYYGETSTFSMTPAIIYLNDTFIRTGDMSCFVDRYTKTKKKKIGFTVVESVTTSGDDETLLDPATGSYNYNAPGADRYTLGVYLDSYDYNVVPSDDFYQYAIYDMGRISRSQQKVDPLAGIGDSIAKKAYLTNGNYVINGCRISIKEHLNDGNNNGLFLAGNGGDATKLAVIMDPGSAVTGGRMRELGAPAYNYIDKATSYISVTDAAIATAYGNYFLVDEMTGIWDVDGSTTVTLYDTAQDRVSSGYFSDTSSNAISGNVVGTAKVRHLVLDNGTAGTSSAQYRLYLYDLKMRSGGVEDVRAIYYDRDAGVDGIADCVLESGSAVLKEQNYNKLLWKLPYNSVKSVDDTNYSFKYVKEWDTELDGNSSVTLSLTGNYTFPFNGSLTNTQIAANVQVLVKDDFTDSETSYSAGEYIDLSGHISVSSNTDLTIDLGNTINTTTYTNRRIRVYTTVQLNDETPIGKTLEEGTLVKLDAGTTPYTSSTKTFTLGICDALRVTSITASSNADYTTGAIDVTNQFRFVNGQTDNLYEFASIRKKNNSTLDLATYRYLKVTVDHFSRSPNTAQFSCVNSYPVDDTGASGILTQEIPIYRSKIFGKIDLRSALDFRPYTTNTATTTSILSSATVNPNSRQEIDRPSGGLQVPVPVEEFALGLDYYLGKAFRVVLDNTGEIRILESASGTNPRIPAEPDDAMTMAVGNIPPYPSLAPASSKYYKRPDLKVSYENETNRRYTMQDIQGLEKRISSLEYYTALSMMEKDAKDQPIPDSNGVDRFKSGILVDPFTGHNINDVAHPDNHCSLDTQKRHLRAYFNQESIRLTPASIAAGTTTGQTGTMFHVPYYQAVYQEQLQASKSRIVAGELVPPVQSPQQSSTASPPTTTTSSSTSSTTSTTPAPPPVTSTNRPPVAQESFNLIRYGCKKNVGEGNRMQILVETTNLPEGATFDWYSTGLGVTAADFDSIPVGATSYAAGTGTIDSAGDCLLTWDVAEDSTTEGNENFAITIDFSGSGLGTKEMSFTLVDTSTTPVITRSPTTNPPVYNGSANVSPDQDLDYDKDTSLATVDSSDVTGSYPTYDERPDAYNVSWEWVGEEWVSDKKETSRVKKSELLEHYDDWYFDYYSGINYPWSEYSWDEVSYDVKYKKNKQFTGTWNGMKPEDTTQSTWGGKKAYTYIRSQSLQITVRDLAPNRSHTATIASSPVNSTTFTTNGAGNGTCSLLIPANTVGVGTVTIQIADSNGLSTAQTYFTGGGGYYSTYKVITTRWPEPPTETRTVAQFFKSETLPTVIENEQWSGRYGNSYAGYSATTAAPPKPTTPPQQPPKTTANPGDYNFAGQSFNPYDDLTNTISNFFSENTYKTIATTKPPTTTTAPAQTPAPQVVSAVVKKNVNTQPAVIDSQASHTMINPYDDSAVIQAAATAAAAAAEMQAIYDIQLASAIYNTGGYGGWGACGGYDPLAQTFLIEGLPGGIFVTEVDLYFSELSSEEDNNGITLEIREVINGVPGPMVLPNAKSTKRRSDCMVSTTNSDGTVTFNGTIFKFDNPVYLENNKEYCIIPVPHNNDTGYACWVAELGQNEIGTTKKIDKQAHTGVLFSSANNRTWTPHQGEDLMFSIKRCVFDVDTDYTVVLNNDNFDWLGFTSWSTGSSFTPGDFINGFTFTINDGGEYGSAPTVSFSGGNGTGLAADVTWDSVTGAITAITVTNPGYDYTDIPTLTINGGSPVTDADVHVRLNRGYVKYWDTLYDTGYIKVTDGYFTAGDILGVDGQSATISNVYNRVVDAFYVNDHTMEPDGTTKLNAEIAWTPTGGPSSTTTTPIPTKRIVEGFSSQRTIYSYSNEVADLDSEKSMTMKYVLRTDRNNISPMVDVDRILINIMTNDINDDSSGEETQNGGTANSKYISRKVILAPGQDAEDLKVWLDNQIPPGCDVEVYAKLKNLSDDGDYLEDVYWKKLTVEDSPFETTNDFGEYVYTIPNKGSTDWGVNSSGIFEYDVTRINTIPVSSGGNYSGTPDIIITHSGDGSGATAVAHMNGTAIDSIEVLNPGRGYSGGTITVTVDDTYETTPAVIGAVTTDTVTYTGFKEFSVKVVHLSPRTYRIPKTQNLRVYALQA